MILSLTRAKWTMVAVVAVVAGGFGLGAGAAEYVPNGNFESTFYGTGVPNFWKGNGGDGSANFRETNHLSPFNNIFPAGSQSVALRDGNTDGNFPNLLTDVLPGQSLYAFSFEFSMGSVSSAPWLLRVGDGSGGINFSFAIGGSNQLQYVGGTASPILTLTTGVWYQVNATVRVDDNSGIISGTATPFGASPIAFSGRLYPGGPASSSYLEVLDTFPDMNGTLYLDNVSIRTVPEPGCGALLVLGLVMLQCRRQWANRASHLRLN